MSIILFAVGLVFLIAGAEALVRGASRLAALLGLSPLVIGLTVVAFGTSSPELAVSIESSLSGQADIAVGNVIGSNIFNVLFILGVSALITPLIVARQLIRLDVPVMIGLSILVLVLALDKDFGRVDGLVLVTGLVVYVGFLIFHGRKETAQAGEANDGAHTKNRWIQNIAMIVGGLVLLVLGSRWLVDGAVSFARHLGISELVIGLTLVAAGTSLPEVVTSIIAAVRGERDIAVGNVIGSNIFNIMGVLGLASLVAPGGIEISSTVVGFDIPVMIAAAAACLPIFFTGGVISRPEGLVLVGYYAAYTLYLILAASSHSALPMFSAVMLYFVIPLTGITLTSVTIQALRKGRSNTCTKSR